MAATLLAPGVYKIDNVPDLRDVKTMSHLLESIGASVRFGEHLLELDTSKCSSMEAPYDLVKKMRASIYVLGPMISRFGYGKVSLPGGCAWGPRPVDLHIKNLRKLGANIKIDKGYIIANAKELKGSEIEFDIPSVGATGNLLMAAVLAKGTTIIKNAAKEPEIVALTNFLQKMGAEISGTGTDNLIIHGVKTLKPASISVIADRIEAGTFLVAANLTGGDIRLNGVDPNHITAVINKLKDSGAQIRQGKDWVRIESDCKILPVNVTTAVYPGFPTDMQAQWMSLMSVAQGSSIVTEKIFMDRFTHVAELQRLGADIILDHNVAFIKGTSKLSGAHVMSTDLRASASLILAGLVAKGQTDISRVYHIDRGYESIEKKLKLLGANIWRDQEELIA
jgi:UDP-N-acetylglucosamine 1-carboxyvinyltransferase